jgi:phasin family protein
MSDKSPVQSFVDMFSKLGQDLKLPSVEVEKLVAHHQKNLEALEKTTKAATEGATNLMVKQREILENTVRDITDMATSFRSVGNPQEMMAKQADFAKRAFEAALRNTRDVAEVVSTSGGDVFKIVQARIAEAVDEARTAFEKKT